jgi:hypothetical protein
MGSLRKRRPGAAFLVTGLVIGALLGPAACDGGNRPILPSARPSPELSATRSRAAEPESPSPATSPSARPPRTEGTTPTPTQAPTPTVAPTQPPTSAAVLPPAPTQAPTPTAVPTRTPSPTPPSTAAAPTAASPSTTATAAKSGGLGTLAWILLIALVAALIGGLLIWRARRRSAWDTEATTLEADTRTAVTTRLPPVLTAQTAGQRALTWPPLRAGLMDLVGRWDLLAQRAPGELRRNRALQLRGLVQDLVAAVDAENEALASGRDSTLLRPRVEEAERALSAALAPQPRPDVLSG